MARPPAVDGGRPHRVTVRYSDREIDALDQRRGPLNRPDYIRAQTVRPAATTEARTGRPPEGGQMAPRSRVPLSTRDTSPDIGPSDDHVHSWSRQGQYLDVCDCGAERTHQTGTR